MSRLFSLLRTHDERLFFYINQNIHKRWLDKWMCWFTHFGGPYITILIPLILMVLFRGGVQVLGIQAAASLLFSHILMHFMKLLFSRKRPHLVIEGTRMLQKPLKDYSFPSGHTTAIFSIMIVFAIALPILAPLFIMIAILVGLSRVYLGFHYPSDILVGGTLGAISAFLCAVLIIF